MPVSVSTYHFAETSVPVQDTEVRPLSRVHFTATDPSSRKLVGFIHEGRCASLGRSENATGFESDSYSQQINFTREGTPIHAGQLSSYKGDHAFVVHASGATLEDDSGAVLACGDI